MACVIIAAHTTSGACLLALSAAYLPAALLTYLALFFWWLATLHGRECLANE
ncbi:hypothetical protein JIN84_18015 [Luteolibacter yonseiensis]|uniref:Uncharacterized protein n=1 Tax=Luteolibacter yonseiensis TaxID=1144680 RepID=A0A934V8R0_9BACT|nr:hypothetical protein [Luteolibacter yonseiensis]MBK1817522.1 hypothetical protein [Luteolibacter yonseiensis]